tara:strand:+ start:220 stop:834 length:615 start_codon:yes stop_codon:yes gene_type:complete
MKKFLITLFVGLLICNTSVAKSKSTGKGDLKLSDSLVEYFMKYSKSKGQGNPYIFVIAPISDKRNYARYWFCPSGNCRFENISKFINACEKTAKEKYKKKIKCFIFAKKRTIVWDNGINPGKGKKSKVRKKWNKQEYIAKLTELGFYGENATTQSEIKTEKKVEKKSSDSNLSISNEIKKLNELYKDGTLTKEEFEAAKKKLLN